MDERGIWGAELLVAPGRPILMRIQYNNNYNYLVFKLHTHKMYTDNLFYFQGVSEG